MELEVISVKDVMEMLNISRKEATRILNIPGCPILPRHKGQTFRVLREPFLAWLKECSFRR